MTWKDAARIMRSLEQDKTPRELARDLWGINLEIVKMQVIDDEAIMEFGLEFVTLIIKWIGISTEWLWDLLLSLMGIHPQSELVEGAEVPIVETEEENAGKG